CSFGFGSNSSKMTSQKSLIRRIAWSRARIGASVSPQMSSTASIALRSCFSYMVGASFGLGIRHLQHPLRVVQRPQDDDAGDDELLWVIDVRVKDEANHVDGPCDDDGDTHPHIEHVHHCPRFVLGRTRYSLSCLGSAGHRYRTLPSGRRKRDSGTPCAGHTIDVTFFTASPASGDRRR